MTMTPGGETTTEENVIYGYEVQIEINKAITKMGLSGRPYEERREIRRALEDLVWACVKDYV